MRFVVVEKEKAEKTRARLVELGVFANSYKVKKEEDKVLFPVTSCPKGFNCIEMEASPSPRKPRSLREALVGVIPASRASELVTSFDVVGDIAIIQIPEGLEDKAGDIGEALMRVHPNVKVVCWKLGARGGIFRLAPLKVISGENRFTTVYTENGVKMKVDVSKAYFSPRLATERKRIADLVKDGETVAVFFAGVGPFALIIAKMKRAKVYAVELNPYAYSLMEDNVKMNRLAGEVIPIHGDVKEVYNQVPRCDRVVMPLPKGGENFLEIAFKTVKEGGFVHFYQFAPEERLYDGAIHLISEITRKLGKRVKIIGKKVVRSHKPRVYQVVIDFQVI